MEEAAGSRSCSKRGVAGAWHTRGGGGSTCCKEHTSDEASSVVGRSKGSSEVATIEYHRVTFIQKTASVLGVAGTCVVDGVALDGGHS